jgi:hypothetical protein
MARRLPLFDVRHIFAYAPPHVLSLDREMHGVQMCNNLLRHRPADGAHAPVRSPAPILRRRDVFLLLDFVSVQGNANHSRGAEADPSCARLIKRESKSVGAMLIAASVVSAVRLRGAESGHRRNLIPLSKVLSCWPRQFRIGFGVNRSQKTIMKGRKCVTHSRFKNILILSE